MKRSVQSSGAHEYLQIVESVRDGDRVRQRVVANLGRRDRLVAEGALDGLLASLAKFSERLRAATASSLRELAWEGVAVYFFWLAPRRPTRVADAPFAVRF